MKRNLLGVAFLLGIVGLGSAGVYAGRKFLAPAAPAATDVAAEEAAEASTVPTPIRLAPREEAPPQANPFARGAAPRELPAAARDVPPVHDRYADARQAVADESTPAEIPDASELAGNVEPVPVTRAADPFGARRRGAVQETAYAERPVAAEIPDQDMPADVDPQALEAEPEPQPTPRRLGRAGNGRSLDRYGRPVAAEEPQAVEPALEEPRAAEPQAEEPVVEEAAVEPEPVAVAGGADAADADEGTGRPGDPQLSGSQAPMLTIEKTAPAEIQIGKPAKFLIKVRNAGTVAAHGVEIHDTVPQGTQFMDALPEAQRGAQGALVWDLGTLKSGEEKKVELQLMPVAEGEVGSVASVHFRAEASVRTVATKPMLTVDVTGPDKAMKGQEITLRIKLSNPGSGAATGVVLTENVPDGFKHSAGSELEFEVGTLKPGETRELELGLTAAVAGLATNVISAQGEGNLRAEARNEIEIVAPQLQVSMTGPKRRYLERNATHSISVTNPGTAAAKDIELVAVLPRELKFVEANNGGQFDAATQSVYWSLEELPPQESGTVTLTTLPLRAGEAKLVIKSAAQAGLVDQREEVVAIEGLEAINFHLSDVNDPIEAGGQNTYEVRVTNQGTKAASNVRVVAVLPSELKAVAAEGPVRYKIEGQRVVFEPLKQLAPKADTSFMIKVQALQPGDIRLQVQISTDEIREPITREESTRVFGNE